MNVFIRWVAALTLSLLSAPVFAGGKCEGQAPAHENFCVGKNKHLCGVHSGVCSWKESKAVEVVVKGEDKSCVAKAGKEAHQGFCKGHNRQVCTTHSGLCIWKQLALNAKPQLLAECLYILKKRN